MNEPQDSWLGRHIDLIYKLVLVALVTLWVLVPPQPSQPMARDKLVRVAPEIGTVR